MGAPGSAGQEKTLTAGKNRIANKRKARLSGDAKTREKTKKGWGLRAFRPHQGGEKRGWKKKDR